MNEILTDRLREYRGYVEVFLDQWLDHFRQEPQKKLFESMRYSLLAGGKRLRPVFAFEFCRMCGKDWKKAVHFAGAIEMIHNYSLIHDDLPSMDNDDYRRGRLTNHKVYGEGMSILAGDALLTDAFAMAALANLPTKDVVSAVRVLSQCAGSGGMVGGQVLDIMSEQRVCTEQEVLDIQYRKTGGLIRAACVMGTIAGSGSEQQLHAAAVFADHLGLAFQIRDDMLDVIGDSRELGKATGVDGAKNTFVRLYGLERCEELVQKHTDLALQALTPFDDRYFLTELARSLTDRQV